MRAYIDLTSTASICNNHGLRRSTTTRERQCCAGSEKGGDRLQLAQRERRPEKAVNGSV
jgi:hypothetical protein